MVARASPVARTLISAASPLAPYGPPRPPIGQKAVAACLTRRLLRASSKVLREFAAGAGVVAAVPTYVRQWDRPAAEAAGPRRAPTTGPRSAVRPAALR